MQAYYDFFVSNTTQGDLEYMTIVRSMQSFPYTKTFTSFTNKAYIQYPYRLLFGILIFYIAVSIKINEEDPWQFEVEGSERLNKNCLHRIFLQCKKNRGI